MKLVWTPNNNILDQFGNYPVDGAVPLFVSEGSAETKQAAIGRSAYLTFAYTQFVNHSGPLVVFGHALGAMDRYLINAMKGWGKRPIAISIRRPKHEDDTPRIIRRKMDLCDLLRGAELHFFDAATHPLSDPASARLRRLDGTMNGR